ncbi:hypothetical protein F4859DRAFT_522810 [Xylaria cf. heliscus]|nr:hypothetical protein F4859DRAFT_522810 [Xylaria cf. heliscus]
MPRTPSTRELPPRITKELPCPNPTPRPKLRRFNNTAELLQYFYQDITRLSEVSSPYLYTRIIDRERTVLVGLDKAQARMEALKEATGGTLLMDVERIIANRNLGMVFGFVRAQSPGLQDLALRFCGIWRFVDGIAVEHSEATAEDPVKLDTWLWRARLSRGQ